MKSPRILIVEDEPITALALQRMLESMGYITCEIAHSGEEAVKMAETAQPALVLMDIILKGEMDGVKTATAMRERLNIPVVYVTAFTDEGVLERAKITDPFGYIIKPFMARELRVVIEMALYRHKASVEREMLIRELREALSHVRTLSGLLPICAWCKKIRDDKGYWQQLEAYIKTHSGADFTHGICPECAGKISAKPRKKPK